MATQKSGSLTIAGSGIASIGHITLETLSYIEQADKVYYAVADPATEAFIHDHSKGECFDLTAYYDTDKSRFESYIQMSEVMLRDVRSGHSVLGIFYGHPGVFVCPSHRAISIALSEGYKARMLPGISAEDYMFSDLGFDPAIPGCMTQEATHLVIHNKKLDTSIHNIIWQVGGVGVTTMTFDNRQFHKLVDCLERDFGSSHKVVHYIGAVIPQSAAVIDEFSIADLRKEDVVKKFTSCSTFYVPPRDAAHADESMTKALGLTVRDDLQHTMFPTSTRLSMRFPGLDFYGRAGRAAVANLDKHTPPKHHQVLRASPAVRKFMEDLALKPDLRDRYKADPLAVLDTIPDLTPGEDRLRP